jgi:hypothetical protein
MHQIGGRLNSTDYDGCCRLPTILSRTLDPISLQPIWLEPRSAKLINTTRRPETRMCIDF